MMQDKQDPNYVGNEQDEIYKENILDHYKNPRNFGKMEDFTSSAKEHNPTCGDNIEVFIKIEKGKVKDIKFRGHGCAISMASASMLTERVKGLNVEKANGLKNEEILTIIGIKLGPVRMKCGLLGFKALIKAMEKSK